MGGLSLAGLSPAPGLHSTEPPTLLARTVSEGPRSDWAGHAASSTRAMVTGPKEGIVITSKLHLDEPQLIWLPLPGQQPLS